MGIEGGGIDWSIHKDSLPECKKTGIPLNTN